MSLYMVWTLCNTTCKGCTPDILGNCTLMYCSPPEDDRRSADLSRGANADIRKMYVRQYSYQQLLNFRIVQLLL